VHVSVMTSVSMPIAIPRAKEPEVSEEADFWFPATPSPPSSWNTRLRQRAERWGDKTACSSCPQKSARASPSAS
jgi:hypothetical protein